MSLAARYEIRPGMGWPRLATAGAAGLSLAAHVLLVATVLYPWSVSLQGPPPSIDVTLIAIPERRVAALSPSQVRPPSRDRAAAVVPAPEALPVPPVKPAPPVIEQDAAPAVAADAAVASRPATPRRNRVPARLVTMVVAEREPLPRQQADVQTRDFAALAAKMPESAKLPGAAPAEPVAQGPIVDAGLVAGLQPEYPILARRRGYQGRVVIAATVLPSGAVEFASLVASSGYDVLDHAALEAVRRWRLLPARLDGKAVDGRIEIPFDFVLQ